MANIETNLEVVERAQRLMRCHTETLMVASETDSSLIDLAELDATIRKLLLVSHSIKDKTVKWPVKELTGVMGRPLNGSVLAQ